MLHWIPLSWLKRLFGEKLPPERLSIRDTYLTLKAEEKYDEICDGWRGIPAIRTVEQGTDETLADTRKYYGKETPEKAGKGKDKSMAEIPEHVKALPEQLPGPEEKQLRLIIAYLAEADGKSLKRTGGAQRPPVYGDLSSAADRCKARGGDLSSRFLGITGKGPGRLCPSVL